MFGQRQIIVTLLLAINIRAQSVGEAVAYHEGKVYYPAKEPVPQPEIREPIIIDEPVKQSQTTVSAATEPSPQPQQPASSRNATMLNSTMITAPPSLLPNVNASDNATQYQASSSKNDSTNSTKIADSQNDTDKDYTAPVRDEVSSGSAVVTSLLYSSALLAMMFL
ncbi:hypothetical protein MIR68_002831 [Amoeboaphelidium protococcarum]|nr:hypothetical protein MIR68_002831 [Amoeboaphelidium protococcarum]